MILFCQVVDPIYDGVFYLNAEHQRRLKEEYGKFSYIEFT